MYVLPQSCANSQYRSGTNEMISKWWLDQVHAVRQSSDIKRMKQTIFGGILTSKLPDEEKTDIRLASEAQLVVFAGEGTTGRFSVFDLDVLSDH